MSLAMDSPALPGPEPTAPVQVVALAGSLRAASVNRRLLAAAVDLAPKRMRVEVVDPGTLPLYNADLDEDVGGEASPEPVRRLKAALTAAHGLLIVSPEYNWSIPGVLKNAIDWVSRPAGRSVLAGRPTALMGASPGPAGTGRAQLHLREAFLSTGTPVLLASVQLGQAGRLFDEAGRLVDEASRGSVADLMSELELAAAAFRVSRSSAAAGP